MEFPRRTILDLIARYELEPELLDVFVEGDFDRDVLSRCYEKARRFGIVVYDIDTVDVPAEVLTKFGLSSGNKQRVIALAKSLSESPSAELRRYLVDKDVDEWLGRMEVTAGLVWTRYCNLECYMYKEEVVRDIVSGGGGISMADWSTFYLSFQSVLARIFALRLADADLSLKLKWVDIHKCVSIHGGAVVFDCDGYVARILSKNNASASKNKFVEKYNAWLRNLIGDVRQYTRGHDFVNLIAFSIRELKGYRKFADTESVSRTLVVVAASNPDVFEEIIDTIGL